MGLQETRIFGAERTPALCNSSALDELLVKNSGGGHGFRNETAATVESSALIGVLCGLTEAGVPLVYFGPNCVDQPAPARSVYPIGQKDIGREVVLSLENGDPKKPIVLGLLQPKANGEVARQEPESASVSIDGEVVTFTGRREIVLRCGKASITLTRAGKILIRGAYLLSRSSGVNRIKGGSVQIN